MKISEIEEEKVKSCLQGFTDQSAQYLHVCQTWIEKYTGFAKPKIAVIVGNLRYDETNNVIDLLLRAVGDFMAPARSPRHKSLVGHGICALVAKTLESRLLKLTISLEGASQFERDIKRMQTHCIEKGWATRDTFARINQICIVLGVNSPEEIAEYWGIKSRIVWRFDLQYIGKLLSLRADFTTEEIDTSMKLL